jgi:hypothetical protein
VSASAIAAAAKAPAFRYHHYNRLSS